MQCMIGAIFMKLGRVPTIFMILSGLTIIYVSLKSYLFVIESNNPAIEPVSVRREN